MLGEGHGNPLQYSCLGNPMDRAAWRASPQGLQESDTAQWLSTHFRGAGCIRIARRFKAEWTYVF